ncbi:hypothetical protein [Parabacteroides acidifaciens]|nr:hypothetical protein [Parabacteroides acidifaciens]
MMVIEVKLDPGYVLDRMEFYEIEAILEKLHCVNRDSWEQARLISYVMAQSNSTKQLKPTDLIKFPWDDKNDNTGNTSVNTEDMERLRKKAEEYIKSK